MPLTVARPANAYRLDDSDDLHAMFEAHAAAGWICQLVCRPGEAGPVWAVRMQLNDVVPTQSIDLDRIVVSDLMRIDAFTATEYASAYPESPLPEGS